MLSTFDRPHGKLILADGSCYNGYLEHSNNELACGEVVFNTSMTGYQEVITDPSYAGQLIVMTYPQIGNYGVSPNDNEGTRPTAKGLVVRELAPFFSPGPDRTNIKQFLRDTDLVCLSGVDTRAITRHIRSGGTVAGIIAPADLPDEYLTQHARRHEYSNDESLVRSVTGARQTPIDLIAPGHATRGRAALIDLGVKRSIVKRISAMGIESRIFDMNFKIDDILHGDFDCMIISNGPGDPANLPGVIKIIEALIGKIPILGICLGHQITALALGGSTYKMKFGHRGANHPVICRRTGMTAITSQNHGYAVSDRIERSDEIEITYINGNDGSVEGFSAPHFGIECVQFHPEAGPGPHDTLHLFEEFINKAKGNRYATVA